MAAPEIRAGAARAGEGRGFMFIRRRVLPPAPTAASPGGDQQSGHTRQ